MWPELSALDRMRLIGVMLFVAGISVVLCVTILEVEQVPA